MVVGVLILVCAHALMDGEDTAAQNVRLNVCPTK